jgi:hypothetical protein
LRAAPAPACTSWPTYVVVARETETTEATLANSTRGLHIGAGKGLEPGTFWKGLIDDVRIYDRAVQP